MALLDKFIPKRLYARGLVFESDHLDLVTQQVLAIPILPSSNFERDQRLEILLHLYAGRITSLLICVRNISHKDNAGNNNVCSEHVLTSTAIWSATTGQPTKHTGGVDVDVDVGR